MEGVEIEEADAQGMQIFFQQQKADADVIIPVVHCRFSVLLFQ